MAKRKNPVIKFKDAPTKKEQGEKKASKKNKAKKVVSIPVTLPIESKDAIFPQPVELKRPEIETPVVATESVKERVKPEIEKKDLLRSKREVAELKKEKIEQESYTIDSRQAGMTKKDDYFPSISRSIPESFSGRVVRSGNWFLFGVVLGILIVAIALISWNIQSNMQEKKQLEQNRAKIQGEVNYWREMVNKYPGNRDAYFQLALLEYQLGDTQASSTYVTKVKLLDPNFQEAYKLEKVLGSK